MMISSPATASAVSIHALMKRATPVKTHDSFHHHCFNPRPHEEGDRNSASQNYKDHGFNPRPREEGDVSEDEPLFDDRDFNPRPREEGDAIQRFNNRVLRNFNPRPREEGDKSFPKWMLSALQFQSTPS